MGPIPPIAALTLQQLLGNKTVLALLNLKQEELDEGALQEEAGSGELSQEQFSQEKIDEIVSEIIAEELDKYNSIPVVIKEERPVTPPAASQVPAGAAPAEPAGAAPQEQNQPAEKTSQTVTEIVFVKAHYFMNPGSAEVKAARKAAGFDRIANSLGDQLSELNGKAGRLTAATAVKFGKATPEDLAAFMDQVVSVGAIHKFGREKRLLKEGDLLVDLDPDSLQKLIQDWMFSVRAGVDCTGIINIALVRAREKVREEMRAAGIPEEELPKSLGRGQRPVKGDEVTKATDLRPGDIWVTREGEHVRIVMEAHEGVDKKGNPVIEFKTAESSSIKGVGPIDKAWHTQSLEAIQDIKKIKGQPGDTKDGRFFRVKEPD